MERNKYIIKSFQTKIKDIEVRASKDNRLVTSHEKKTILHYKRYIEFARGADFTLRCVFLKFLPNSYSNKCAIYIEEIT